MDQPLSSFVITRRIVTGWYLGSVLLLVPLVDTLGSALLLLIGRYGSVVT